MITLYHGTSTRHLPAILRDGILPREEHGNSNWEGPIASKDDFVYLTDAYPVYFAYNAANGDEDLAVVRVTVPQFSLYPDEDYIALCLKRHDPKFRDVPLAEINRHINLPGYRQYWRQSLMYNGKVAVRSVAPNRITGHVVIPHGDIRTILNTGADAVPTPIPYAIFGSVYREIISEMFLTGPAAAAELHRKRMFGGMEVPI